MRRPLLLCALLLALPAAAQAQQEPESNYPALAAQQGIGGSVLLECLVAENGRLGCEVVEETPAHWDFGPAAVEMSTHWRVSPRTDTGQSTAGGRLRRTLVFEPGPPPRIRHASARRPTQAP